MDLLEALGQQRVLAIIRADGPELALSCLRTLVAAGVTALEISLTTPGGITAIKAAQSEFGPEVLLGAGTVMTTEEADEVAAAGAAFAVTPGITKGARRIVDHGVPLLCGALTPTEVIAALDLGAVAVKIFPARLLGPSYLAELRAPLPGASFIAVGGVDAESAPQYLRAGALAAGIGSTLLADAGSGGDLAALTQRAERLLKAVGDA
ncbi:bifunctional 4-hydroxy-2-oxoglutarate aldolase/2-dehydro-3-deoxy-phosphogluconate aldolase [Kribbella turkmenica]|uniref:Bifunctional 4-hydroxy-2-oxoglutarate aldolase/2-dehydro-3-deoxy-phosphogluconate aldolase n=1 Tax=Kribbella turkmenica TaxID=2530375 RepID=A0A4R4X8S6_9ACTN|nr:bifunctional 4-hydroxy-2-oxoglutarate aldolase/2-dehydro-3-deoxy-phosphogluconate aldolase [Kribbella turkmenica]TDD26815.1 bifunctional 4-hydroxy-2-oxoglutarate aldolase/2-dehydro-3-deoxy-phosphogluconate aldolase [Kribbella turkmenica]